MPEFHVPAFSRSDCLGCRSMPVPGALLFGPCLGVTLVVRCPSCDLLKTDREAACLASAYLDLKAVESEGRWYLDFLAKDSIEPSIAADLDARRTRSLERIAR
jgi:hypothetical protein